MMKIGIVENWTYYWPTKVYLRTGALFDLKSDDSRLKQELDTACCGHTLYGCDNDAADYVNRVPFIILIKKSDG